MTLVFYKEKRKERKVTSVRIPMESWKEVLNAERVCQARAFPWDETEVF